jgi:PPOX class probable F420-dependent enzyme
MTTVPDTHRDLLDAPLTATLTTIDGKGRPQASAVWYLLDDDGLVHVSTLAGRQKHKNLSANGSVSLFVLDPANPFRWVDVRGDVKAEADPDKQLVGRLAAKHGMDPAALASTDPPGSERVAVVIHPRAFVVQ